MRYPVIQTLLFAAFFAAYARGPGPALFSAEWPRALGAALCAGALVLFLAALAAIGRAFRIAPEPRPGAGLVTRGIYRGLRHPMYTSVAMLAAGLFLTRPTAAVGALAAATIAFFLAKARHEETLLVALYPEYAAYRERTWGVIPGLGRRRRGRRSSRS
jgi:protein-S-isoprenylcysteine O-methyltransferase Ste14